MPTRRTVVASLLAGLAGLTGCSGGSDSTGGTPTAADPPLDYESVTRTTPTPRGEQLDVSTNGGWPQFAANAANTGVGAGQGLPGKPGKLWEAWTRTGAVAGPIVHGHRCYVGTEAGALLAIDRQNGRIDWRSTVDGGTLWSPATDGEQVVVHAHEGDEHQVERGGQVVAFDVADGTTTWTQEVGSNPNGAPTIAEDAVLVASPYRESVFCLELDDGSVRWTADVSPVGPTIAVRDGVAYVAASQERVLALDVATGDQRWEFLTGTYQPIQAAPVAGENHVVASLQYGPSTLVLDRQNGEKRWSDDTLGSVTATPALADGVVVLGDEAGTVIAYDVASGDQQWTRSVDSVAWRPIAAVGETVYISTGKPDADTSELVALALDDGADEWRVTVDGATFGPVVVDGYCYVGTDRDSVYCLGAQSGGGQE